MMANSKSAQRRCCPFATLTVRRVDEALALAYPWHDIPRQPIDTRRVRPIAQTHDIQPPAGSPRGYAAAATWFVLITVFLDVMAMGMMLPALPKLVESFIPGDTAHAARIFGLFGMAWGLMQFVGAPILGALSDRHGRRPVILLSNLGLGLDYVVMALAPTLWVLMLGRLIAGFCTASISTAFAYIADITAEENRATEFGKIGAVFGLGFIVGPAVGGQLAGIDARLPFWVAAGLSFANFVYGYLVLPESLSPDRRTPFTWKRTYQRPFSKWIDICSSLLQFAVAG